MTRDEFEERYIARLNDQQREAVEAVEGAALLLAVPGSGKTTVLVIRLGYMLYCCGINPGNYNGPRDSDQGSKKEREHGMMQKR